MWFPFVQSLRIEAYILAIQSILAYVTRSVRNVSLWLETDTRKSFRFEKYIQWRSNSRNRMHQSRLCDEERAAIDKSSTRRHNDSSLPTNGGPGKISMLSLQTEYIRTRQTALKAKHLSALVIQMRQAYYPSFPAHILSRDLCGTKAGSPPFVSMKPIISPQKSPQRERRAMVHYARFCLYDF